MGFSESTATYPGSASVYSILHQRKLWMKCWHARTRAWHPILYSTHELLRGKSIRSEETAPASNNPAHSCPSCLQETAESIPEADPALQPGEGTALTSPATQSLSGRSANWLEMRRLEVELGPAGDHDTPYRFTLPTFMPQTLAWMQLLVKVHSGELEP